MRLAENARRRTDELYERKSAGGGASLSNNAGDGARAGRSAAAGVRANVAAVVEAGAHGTSAVGTRTDSGAAGVANPSAGEEFSGSVDRAARGGIAESHGSTSAPALAPRKFAQLSGATSKRYVVTAKGTFHLTPTELVLVRAVEELDGASSSRAELARRLHRNPKVISRLISNLRREGIIQSEPIYSENGAQLANRYWIAPDAKPLEQ